MAFAHPWFLLLLLLLPALAWLKGKRGQPPAFLYSSVQLVRAVLNVSRSRSGAFLTALLLVFPRFTRWFAAVLVSFFGSEVLHIAYARAERLASG